MRILLDTSILVRTAQPSSPAFATTVDAVTRLRQAGFIPCLVPQICYEFWAVVTRPVDVNGLGLSSQQATLELAQLASLFSILRDERVIFERWQNLVSQYEVIGKKTHDARLVAAMLRHGITHLLTLNPSDFRRYSTIKVLEPSTVSKVSAAS